MYVQCSPQSSWVLLHSGLQSYPICFLWSATSKGSSRLWFRLCKSRVHARLPSLNYAQKKKKCRNLDSSPSLGLLFPFPHPCSKLWHLFALLFRLISASLYCTPLHVAYNFIFSSNDLPLSSATRLTVYPVFSARLPSV